jgi:hypothetical protein
MLLLMVVRSSPHALHTTSVMVGIELSGHCTSGDMFRFRTQDGRLTGELQVSVDEMKGTGQGPTGQVQYSLRR